MTVPFRRLAALSFAVFAVFAQPADAQYFGRNKVQYEQFDWRILKSDHFDLYFYPAESLKVNDAGRQSERWYARLSDIFRHQFDRKSLVFYADHPDFQQTNVIGEQPSEGTGGVTEGIRTRVVMPWTGIYKDDEHVLGHELVHVFQYNVAETAPGQGGLARLGVLPLWLVEGMAEYFSLGRNDSHTAMWMRDAVMRDTFPTIKQLTQDPRFFPYRYGQALWAYIGGRWGDRAVVDVYRTALRIGWDPALIRALGLTSDSLSKDWALANKTFYASQIASRVKPDSFGRTIIKAKDHSEYNVGPSLSNDGKSLAFFTTRTNLFGIDLVLADAATGKIIRRLAAPQSDGHFDAISFINSSGTFSPDAKRFAFIVYADGDNMIQLIRTSDGDVQKEFRPKDIGSIYNLAWSPDGNHLVFTGSKGGVSDLYLMDVATGDMKQLTDDRNADVQPAFSPDGKTIAFATDRAEGTSFDKLTFSELQLATLDLATGTVTPRPVFSRGKHINPQWTPDGRGLYFVSDQDGVSDLYRTDLESGQVFRITKLVTGVSGITGLSPAIAVASGTGALVFTVFRNQGHEVIALEPSQLIGEQVDPAAAARVASAATLPPGDVAGSMTVSTYLADPAGGLVSGEDMRVVKYHSSFALDALGQPTVGVGASDLYGPFQGGVYGAVYAVFGDQLSDQTIFTSVQANGQVQDFGGGLYYLNLRRRWNWLVGGEHSPIFGYGYYADAFSGTCASVCQYQVLFRQYNTRAQGTLQYPFSATKRLEFGLGTTRVAWDMRVDSNVYDNSGTFLVGGGSRESSLRDPVYLRQANIALVGDNAYGAFVGPIAGKRYRFELVPTAGTLNFTQVTADARRYFFKRPFTLAFRGLHFGRYGRDEDNFDIMQPMYLGSEWLLRGYDFGSINLNEECEQNGCPVVDRLIGSKIGVFNAELRIPVLGTSSFGLLNFPYLPLEVSPFFDAGMSWTGYNPPDWQISRTQNTTPTSCPVSQVSYTPCAQRIPVFSTGVSFRVNVLGYMIVETYVAKPFQRPAKGHVWGISIVPGW